MRRQPGEPGLVVGGTQQRGHVFASTVEDQRPRLHCLMGLLGSVAGHLCWPIVLAQPAAAPPPDAAQGGAWPQLERHRCNGQRVIHATRATQCHTNAQKEVRGAGEQRHCRARPSAAPSAIEPNLEAQVGSN